MLKKTDMEEYGPLLGSLENILGKGYRKSKDNYAFHCPFCNHRKPKLEIDLHTNEKGENNFGCWVCGTRGKTMGSLLKQLKVSKEQAQEVLKYVRRGEKIEYREENIISLPKEIKFLSQASPTSILANKAKTYLYRRGITDRDFLKYNIGYTTSGEYEGRIIIPSYSENNTLNYFIARTFQDSYAKYKNPRISRDIIFFENLINWDQPIILCEGAFDAIAIKRNAIPILGKIITPTLMKKVISSKVQDIYIALDKDAKKKALEFSEQFLRMGKRVFFVELDEKDPSIMGFKTFTELIQHTEELTLSGILSHKIDI